MKTEKKTCLEINNETQDTHWQVNYNDCLD